MNETHEEDQYIKGYNEGYLISRFDPDTAKKILNDDAEGNPYIEGLVAGKSAHERELFKEHLQKVRADTAQLKPRR